MGVAATLIVPVSVPVPVVVVPLAAVDVMLAPEGSGCTEGACAEEGG